MTDFPTPSMSREPDEDRDVIVHYVKEIHVPDGEVTESWMLWLGQERRSDYSSENEALIAARLLSVQTGRRAWLVSKTGYPPRLIEPT